MAVHRAIGERNPFPYPRLENDNTFIGANTSRKLPYLHDTKSAQSVEPWNRLYSTCTLSSSRHEVFKFDPKAPNDDLDFLLKAKYDHHNDVFKDLNRTRLQEETISDNHDRVLKNKLKIQKIPPPPLNHPIRISEWAKRERLEQAKLAIDSHHTILTNRGYSRKPDGGFFTA